MTAEWYKEQLSNRNYLAPNGFILNLELFRGVDFLCQSVNLPGINMPFTEVPTRFRSLPIVPGGGVSFDDLTLSFIVDEELINYKSIHNWILRNGTANEHMEGGIEYSNGQLLILSSNMNPNHIIDYENLFPISLTPIQFDSTVSDIEYFTAQVTFKFSNYTFRDKDFNL